MNVLNITDMTELGESLLWPNSELGNLLTDQTIPAVTEYYVGETFCMQADTQLGNQCSFAQIAFG